MYDFVQAIQWWFHPTTSWSNPWRKGDDDDDTMKAEERDDEEESTQVKQEDDEDEPEACTDQDMLPDFQHKFTSQLRQSSRQLKVKDFIIAFDPASVYGRRQAFLKGLLITVAWQECLFLIVSPFSKHVKFSVHSFFARLSAALLYFAMFRFFLTTSIACIRLL